MARGAEGRGRPPLWLFAAGGALVFLLAAIVVSSLSRPEPEGFTPTDRPPREAGDRLVEGRVTLDARDPDRWVLFDFSRGAVVREGTATDSWDLAVRRYRIVVNGGEGYAGAAGALSVGRRPWDSVRVAPGSGYVGTRGPLAEGAEHPVLRDWYRYGFFTHLLEPEPRVYVVRTADGRYAKLRLEGYYCTGATPGCLTFRYAYQGDGSRQLAPGGGSAERMRSTSPEVDQPGSSGSSLTVPPSASTTSAPTTSWRR